MHFKCTIALLVCASAAAAWGADVATLAGKYENHSESENLFALELQDSGRAVWTEPAGETGKPVVLRGTWKSDGNLVDVAVGKAERYVFKVDAKLSWSSFGCKGASFGLAIEKTPHGPTKNPDWNVWRSSTFQP